MARVAIVIPVWHHPALVDEAVLSCLEQKNPPDYRIILVNDGCDMAQTRQSLEGWQQAHPDRIALLNQPNQGLSAARNTGIEHALQDPDIEGIFFLDADNRLDSHALALFAKLLDSPDPAGWFYPHLDWFGMEANASNGEAWSLARLASINFSDAGSLVRREVFEAGVRFDTNLKIGFEDWDFWLGAVKAGFVGAPVLESFFRYRKRPESMLSTAMRSDDILRDQLRAKHKWLYATERLPEAWNTEWPRFAFCDSEGGYRISSDPRAPATVTRADILSGIFNKRSNLAESRFPGMLVFYAAEAWEDLRQAKLLDSALYQLEGGLRASPVATLKLTKGALSVRAGAQKHDSTGEILGEADFIAISMHHLGAALDQKDMERIIGYLLENVPVQPFDIQLPEVSKRLRTPLDALMDLVGELILAPMAAVSPRQYTNWRVPVFAPIARDVADNNADGRPALAAKPPEKQIGFVVSTFHFGGIEKCVSALARALVEQGNTCHLFIYGNDEAEADLWMFEPFSKVWVLSYPPLRNWEGGRYMGTGSAEHPGPDLLGDALGPLAQMDIAVNCGVEFINHGLAGLRQRGVRTVSWQHLSETTPYGRSMGGPFMVLGHEAGYDRILTCSNRLATWLAAQGVPRSKLLPLPNGPGYACEKTPRRNLPKGRLRVGFLGRFDPQKQVEYYIDVAQKLRGRFDFKAVGGAVLGVAPDFPDWLPPAPPIRSRAGLDAFYASIDVLIMPSKDEGLPLTILEAQRAGVVVLASDVGAVSEAIIDGDTGFLLPADKVVERSVSVLERLDSNRGLLMQIARAAAGKPDRWEQNATLFIKSLL
ncbi:MAG: glycosyltransferase [Rhodobacteraceae bacterium]|nr:glycosyltransferase [Paracoccaceae bacterium]